MGIFEKLWIGFVLHFAFFSDCFIKINIIKTIDLNNTKYIQQKTQYLFFASILNTFLQTDKDVERQAYETYYFIYLFIYLICYWNSI